MVQEKRITEDMFIPDIVARYPGTRVVLDRYGLKGCGGPQGPREHGAQRFNVIPQTKVGDVLTHYPQSLEVFLRHGFGPLANPVLRKTMARVVTIEQACRREGVSLAQLLEDLNSLEFVSKRTNPEVTPISRIAS